MTESTWLDCAYPGCGNGTTADPRHIANLTAGGGWYCPLHERTEGAAHVEQRDTHIETDPRRRDRKTCAYCEASAAGCRSNEWLRGRRCCEACTGDHDEQENR